MRLEFRTGRLRILYLPGVLDSVGLKVDLHLSKRGELHSLPPRRTGTPRSRLCPAPLWWRLPSKRMKRLIQPTEAFLVHMDQCLARMMSGARSASLFWRCPTMSVPLNEGVERVDACSIGGVHIPRLPRILAMLSLFWGHLTRSQCVVHPSRAKRVICVRSFAGPRTARPL